MTNPTASPVARPPRALTRAEVREVDRRAIEELGVPGVVLMENAGLGLALAVLAEREQRGLSRGVAIVCGRGNNGGDGFVLARHLRLRGVAVEVVYAGDLSEASREGDAGVNLAILEKSGWPVAEAKDAQALSAWVTDVEATCDLLVDALFGTGIDKALRPDARALVEAFDASSIPTIAVDVPSGLDADTGKPLGAAVRAIHTVTFVGEKKGFSAPGAKVYTGEVTVVPIGCPPSAWDHVRA